MQAQAIDIPPPTVDNSIGGGAIQMESEELLTLKQAADECGKEPSTLRRAIQRKRLKATLYGTTYLVKRGDFEEWLRDPASHRSGPKPKARF